MVGAPHATPAVGVKTCPSVNLIATMHHVGPAIGRPECAPDPASTRQPECCQCCAAVHHVPAQRMLLVVGCSSAGGRRFNAESCRKATLASATDRLQQHTWRACRSRGTRAAALWPRCVCVQPAWRYRTCCSVVPGHPRAAHPHRSPAWAARHSEMRTSVEMDRATDALGSADSTNSS